MAVEAEELPPSQAECLSSWQHPPEQEGASWQAGHLDLRVLCCVVFVCVVCRWMLRVDHGQTLSSRSRSNRSRGASAATHLQRTIAFAVSATFFVVSVHGLSAIKQMVNAHRPEPSALRTCCGQTSRWRRAQAPAPSSVLPATQDGTSLTRHCGRTCGFSRTRSRRCCGRWASRSHCWCGRCAYEQLHCTSPLEPSNHDVYKIMSPFVVICRTLLASSAGAQRPDSWHAGERSEELLVAVQRERAAPPYPGRR